MERIERADNVIAKNQAEFEVLQQLKLGLMSDLWTGRVAGPQTSETGAQ